MTLEEERTVTEHAIAKLVGEGLCEGATVEPDGQVIDGYRSFKIRWCDEFWHAVKYRNRSDIYMFDGVLRVRVDGYEVEFVLDEPVPVKGR